METERLFRFNKPEWMNSANTRTAGVYVAGALVCPSHLSPFTDIMTVKPSQAKFKLTLDSPVLPRPLLPPRRLFLLPLQPQRVCRTHPFHRLDPGYLFGAWNAGD